MKPLFWVAMAAILTTTAVTGCRSNRSGGLGAAIERSQRLSDTSEFDSTEATVRIENTKFPDMVIYAISEGGMRTRIGMANGNNTTVLKIPKTLIQHGAELQFLLRPIGGDKQELSDKIYVVPGDEVVLTLTP